MPDDRRDPLIALRIPPTLNERLRAEASDTGSSISEVVRDALEARLGSPEPRPHPADAVLARTRKRRSQDASCPHRVQPGSYCKRCARLVS